MVNYQVSDMAIRIKNAYLVRSKTTSLPYSKLTKVLADILVKEGFLQDAKVKSGKWKKMLVLELRYEGKRSVLTDVEIVSKPSLRVYVSKRKIPRVLGGLGISILSTSKGLMTGAKALKLGLGGELMLKVW